MEQNGNGIPRRQFLRTMAVMGITVAGAGLLGGCSGSRDVATSQAGSSSAATQSQKASSASSSSASSSSAAASSSATASSGQAAGTTFVAVFSWSGNTLAMANRVAGDLQADLFRIEPATPYTNDYDEMLQIAKDEQAADTLPALAAKAQNWDQYSTIYLGFPTWWSHLPQIVKSFLAEHDCSGKVVYPFNTHEGSGFGSCLSDLSAACPNADIREGLSIVGTKVESSLNQVDAWVASNV